MSLVIPEIISLYIRVHVIPKYLPFRTIHDKRKKIGEVKSKGKQYVVSNHFHSVKILLFSSARSRDFDGLIGVELPASIYTTKTPIDLCRFNVRSST